jgi:electron transfer flavoprotein beta subunit
MPKTVSELQSANEDYMHLYNDRPYLNIKEWTVQDIDSNPEELGLACSLLK